MEQPTQDEWGRGSTVAVVAHGVVYPVPGLRLVRTEEGWEARPADPEAAPAVPLSETSSSK